MFQRTIHHPAMARVRKGKDARVAETLALVDAWNFYGSWKLELELYDLTYRSRTIQLDLQPPRVPGPHVAGRRFTGPGVADPSDAAAGGDFKATRQTSLRFDRLS